MNKKPQLLSIALILFCITVMHFSSSAQTNTSVATATVINSFPHTETNVNTSSGGTASGMNGSCFTLPCCSTLVYRVETPSYGSLRVESTNFTPLAGSAIAYTPDIDNPQDWSDLTYFPSWGNFCGFRDSLELGVDYNWTSNMWGPNPDVSDSNRVLPPGVYYVLLFNHNNQIGMGAPSDFIFDFAPYCPNGYSCSFSNVTICDGDSYSSPSGNIYTTSGNYQDTLFGAAYGGLDSLIFTNLTISHTSYDQNVITDETLCAATDTLHHPAQTEHVSFIDLDRSNSNWIECNSVVPSLINTNRSIFGWMKKSTTVSGSSQMIVGINTSGTGNICNFQVGTNEQLGIYDGSNSHYTGVVVTDGQWHFVGYTYDETTNLTKMYVDGVMEGSYTNSQSITATSNRLSIGQEFDGSSISNIFDGILTEVSIWNEVLDSTEIAQIMNSAIQNSHPKYANLQAYYPMMMTCEADDQVVVDHSANSNDGFASHTGIQKSDTLEIIPGFNAAPHYSKNWIIGGTSVSTGDTLELTTYAAGNYELELTRDYYKITNDWTVTIGCPGSSTDIVITEINYNPPEAGSDSTEYIELYNSGPGVVDLEGFHFTNGVTYTFPAAVSLNSGEYLVISVDSVALKNTYNYNTAYQWTLGGLSNGGEPITLKDNLGNLVDSLRYDDVTPWPTAADGGGPSMVLCDPASDNKDGANWIASGTNISLTVNGKQVFGSPGSADNGCSGCVNTTSTINPVACNSYVSPSTNFTWTTSGTYMDTIPNNAGCDSVITVNLTINNSNTGIDTQIACNSFTWIDGNTYTTSNTTATHTLTNAAGCDSIVTLNLTVNYSNTGIDTQTACDSYMWIDGNTYTTNNNSATHTLTNAAGCDSIVTLNLTINNSTTGIDTQVACNSYVWIDGNTYTTSNNTATHTLTNAAGCDSIVTLNLTINTTITGIDTQVACDSYTWIDGNTYTTSNNTATHTLTSAMGCDSIVTLNLTINNSTTGIDTQIACDSYTWIDGITYTAGNNTVTHTLTNAAGCDSIVTLNLTINNSTSGIDTQVACDSYTWIDGVTYTSSNNTATHTLTNNDGCDSIVTLNLTVNNSVTYNAPAVTACDSAQINGNWYNTSQTVTDLFAGGASTGCDSTVYTVLTIQSSPVADAGANDIICEDDTFTLSGSATNELSILWTTSGDGVFDDASKLDAIYTPGVGDIGSGSLDLTLTAFSVSPCATDAVDNMTLSIQQLPVANAGNDDVICENDSYTLSGIASDQQSTIWTTTGDGTFDDATSLGAVYTPGANDISTGTVDLTLTSYSIAPCSNDSVDTMTLTIQPLPTASAGTDGVVCETGTYNLTGIATDYQSILWTTAGDGSFDDATLLTPVYTPGANDIVVGTVDLTITAYSIAPCAIDDSDDMTLTIQYNPLADAGSDATICETDTYTLSGTAAYEQSVNWTTAGDGTFDDATSLTAVYTPGANDILSGSAHLTLTSYATTPCVSNDTDDMIITIQYLPEADAGSDDIVCESGTYQLSGVATYEQNVQWTSSGDGTFDDASLLLAVYTPGTNDIATGTVDLTLTAFAISPCAVDASDDMTLSVQLVPEADAGIDALICETDTYTLSGVASSYQSVLWTTSGDGTFDDATSLTAVYTPGTNDINNGYADLTFTSVAIAPCADNASDVMQLSIQLLPEADAGEDATICEVDTYTLAGTATNEESLLWTTSGDGTFDDPTITGATYTPGVNDLANGSANLTLTVYAIAPCVTQSSDVMLLLIQDQATANAGPDGEVCEGESYTLSGTATNQTHVYWATSGDGVYDDPFLLNATYTPGVQDIENGDVTLTIFAYSIQPCYYEEGDEMLLTIHNIASANAGSDAIICENNTHTLDGQVAHNNGQLWTTAGDGTFDDAGLLNATYTPGSADITNGEVELTLTAFSNPDCGGDATDLVILTIEKMPEQPQLPVGPTAIDLDLTSTTEYTINQVTNAEYYHWELSPIEAGTIEGTDTIGTAYWNADYTGLTAQIYVRVENDYCDPVYSETLEIGLSPVSIQNPEDRDLEITIAPNPSSGRFNVKVTGATDDIELIIINSAGQKVKELNLLNTPGSYTADVDISTNPAGNYYLKFITNRVVITKKVSINKLFR